MKKLALTIAIVLGLSMTTFAGPNDGGLFQRGAADKETNSLYSNRAGEGFPGMPGHGGSSNADAPLGTGIAVLTALGAAYLIGKRRKED